MSAMDELQGAAEVLEAAEIGVLRLLPGDVIVLMHDKYLTMKDVEDIRDKFRKIDAFANHQIAVLDGGLKMGVVRKEADGE